jgi:hypothetical protein
MHLRLKLEASQKSSVIIKGSAFSTFYAPVFSAPGSMAINIKNPPKTLTCAEHSSIICILKFVSFLWK